MDQLLSALYPPRSATEAKTHIPSLLLVDSLASRGCKEDVCTQEPSASEHMATADRSLTRLTNQMSSELAPLGLRALVRRGRCSVFFLFFSAKRRAHSLTSEGRSAPLCSVPEPPPKTPGCNGVDLAAYWGHSGTISPTSTGRYWRSQTHLCCWRSDTRDGSNGRGRRKPRQRCRYVRRRWAE